MGLLVGRVEEGIDHSKMKHVGRYTKRGGAEYWVMIKKGFVLWTGVLTIQTVSLLAPAFFFLSLRGLWLHQTGVHGYLCCLLSA